MNIKEKFNEYIASGDPIISISDEQRDWILPFIERCVGDIRKEVNDRDCTTGFNAQYNDQFHEARGYHQANFETITYIDSLTQEDKIK